MTSYLFDMGAPHALAGQLAGATEAKDAVAMGVAPVSRTMPDTLGAAVTEGSTSAFMNGLHASAVLTGSLCLLGAVLAGVGMRDGAATEAD
ncbi:hypothetical protein [Streptomyces cinerochromogenes]|uniref:hypothetical protein n=1 Tax=Streptomyces cinerochromogenes TaxID=66422 RepID=UPI003F53E776